MKTTFEMIGLFVGDAGGKERVVWDGYE